MRAYLNPAQQHDTWTLPDLEVFWFEGPSDSNGDYMEPGWYYWFCLPGCLPDSEPFGPFESEESALAAARDLHGE